MATENMRIVIDADTDGAVRDVKRVGGALDGLDGSAVRGEKRLGRLGKTAAIGLGVGLGTAAVAAFGFGKASVQAFQEAEAKMAVAEASLDRNNAGWRKHQGEIDKTIAAHTALSGFDDEDLYGSFANLSRITGDTTKAMGLQQTAMDLARAKGMSLEQATTLVGKAQLGNVTSLKKLGIELPKNATALQAIDALNRQFAGSAKAYGDTTAGQAEKMSVAWGNLKEDVGQAIIPLVTSMLSGLTKLITWAQANWPAFRKYAQDAFNAARDAGQRMVSWFNANILPTINRIVAGARAFWAKFGDDVKTYLALVARVIERQFIIIKAIFETVMAVLRGDWGKAWQGIVTIVKTASAQVLDILRTLAGLALSVAGKIGAAIVRGIFNGLKALAGLAGRLWTLVSGGIASVASSAASGAAAIGRAIVQGVWSGIQSLAGWLSSKISGWAGGLLDSAVSRLGIGSPSKVAADRLGAPIVQGVQMGMEREAAKGGIKLTLTKAVKDAITAAKDKATSLAGDLGSSITAGIDAVLGRNLAGLDNSPEAQRLRAIQAQQKAEQTATERANLNGAITGATTPAELIAAQKALADWQLDQERLALEESLAQKRDAMQRDADTRKTFAQRSLADLTDSLNRGLISQKGFNASVTQLLRSTLPEYASLGEMLGSAFANQFAAQITGLRRTVLSITGGRYVLTGGPDRLPSHATGIDYVPRTGPALIHSGEAVLNRQDAAAYRAGGGGGVTVTIADGMGWLSQFVRVQMNTAAEGARRRSLAAGTVR